MSMKNITHIVVHYSATYSDLDYGVAEIDKMHKARGWKGVGYHYVIRRNGAIEKGRPDNQVGAHVGGQNSGKIGICWIGGLERSSGANQGVDNRTPAQTWALVGLIKNLRAKHPGARVVGHRDLAATQCPAFDVPAWWAKVNDAPPPAPPVHTAGVIEGDAQPTGPKHGTDLKRSRTIRGAAMQTIGGGGAVASEKLAPTINEAAGALSSITHVSTILMWLFVALTLAGLGLTFYARMDDAGMVKKGAE